MGKAREEHATVNGVTLWTAVQGSGPPVVLLHGGPGVYDYLEPVAGMIDDIATVYRYDQRGCGRSQDLPPYTVATQVDDLEALRSHWGLDSWVVGGHSWGADLALLYALEHPERVTALLCISGTSMRGAGWREEYHRNREAKLSAAERKRFRHLEERRDTATGDELDSVREERLALLQKTELYNPRSASTPTSYDEFPINYDVNSMLNEDSKASALHGRVSDRAPSLNVPALVVRGEGDPRPESAPRTLAQRLPQGRFVSVLEAGHDIWVERPEALRRVLRDFLGALQ